MKEGAKAWPSTLNRRVDPQKRARLARMADKDPEASAFFFCVGGSVWVFLGASSKFRGVWWNFSIEGVWGFVSTPYSKTQTLISMQTSQTHDPTEKEASNSHTPAPKNLEYRHHFKHGQRRNQKELNPKP